jgi:phosphoribosylaminoimidazolecarboxamide formyltransferase/IMP cyclohydrolase
LRILDAGTPLPREAALDFKRVSGGLLVQDLDRHELTASELKVVTQVAPEEAQIRDLLFAWKCVKHLKSNAIAVAKKWFAARRWRGANEPRQQRGTRSQRRGRRRKGRGFSFRCLFPPSMTAPPPRCRRNHRDYSAWRLQSRRADSIALCDREGIAMVFSGVRHFKH